MSEQPSPGAGAVRLIFEYEGDTVRLVSQEAVDVEIPRFAPTEQQAEHFVETRDDKGNLLSRVPVRGGFVQSTEVFPEDHNEPITRVDTEARGAFTVVVPAPREAVRVAVMRAGRPPVDLSGAPGLTPTPGGSEDVELANFPLERRG
ncbi:hypothetical protein [Micromonospora sp. NPDC005299]|uniref:hypothetical protein n=1 Tax=Micromonospora sp. NPDC005299 TaxID=3364231 RepID=UPI00369BBB13